jgi:hypothetical protein
MPWTEDEVVAIAESADRMARRVRHRFVLDERKLEWLGFSSEQIDRIFERANQQQDGTS